MFEFFKNLLGTKPVTVPQIVEPEPISFDITGFSYSDLWRLDYYGSIRRGQREYTLEEIFRENMWFKTKDEYLLWRKTWIESYNIISQKIRNSKLNCKKSYQPDIEVRQHALSDKLYWKLVAKYMMKLKMASQELSSQQYNETHSVVLSES